MDETNDAPVITSIPVVDRDKIAPFLVRAFIKVGGFHRVSLFEDGQLPTTDEHQVFTWRDATLRELLTTLRLTVATAEFRHPAARYGFRALFADVTAKGRFASKDIGALHSREAVEASALAIATTVAKHPEDAEAEIEQDAPPAHRERIDSDRTLDELKFFPGDYLCVAVYLPKGHAGPAPSGAPPTNGSGGGGGAAPSAAWRDGTWSNNTAAPAPLANRGGGHWRGRGAAPGGGGLGRDAPGARTPPREIRARSPQRDTRARSPPRDMRARTPPRDARARTPPRDGRARTPPRDRRAITPPRDRRGMSPPRGGGGRGRPFDRDRPPPPGRFGREREPERDRERDRDRRRSRSRSRSRSLPRRRNSRYD